MATDIDIITQGIARTTNPTALGNGQPSKPSFDDLGRQLTRPFQVRDLITTAIAILSTGTAATLVTGVSGAFLDLKQISFANNSGASASVAILDESTTVRTIQVPVSSTVHLSFDPPLKQNATGVNWNIDMEDITGTTISVAAEFFQEV